MSLYLDDGRRVMKIKPSNITGRYWALVVDENKVLDPALSKIFKRDYYRSNPWTYHIFPMDTVYQNREGELNYSDFEVAVRAFHNIVREGN